MLKSFKLWMTRQHYRTGSLPNPWLLPLIPLSWFYQLGVTSRLLAYQYGLLKSYQAPVPVISVGNLTTGGTGKTPMVITLAKGLVQSGKTVVILSRGYGAAQPVDYSRALDPAYGDEAYLIQEQVPEAIVIVGKNRVQNLQRSLRDYRPDFVILDDGFQHIQLERDMNILLVDGHQLLGNNQLLPAGPLREPLSELGRADVIFITKTVNEATLKTVQGWSQRFGPIPPKPPIQILPVPFQPAGLRPMGDFASLQSHNVAIESLKTRPVIAFSAIAQTNQFEQDLKNLGLNLIQHVQFEDHHVYTPADVEKLTALMQQVQQVQQAQPIPQEGPILVTTDKDLTKVRNLLPSQIQGQVYTLQMLPLLDGRWFYDEFLTQLHKHPTAGAGYVPSSRR